MGFDDVIDLLGGFGRYQRRLCLLLFLPAILPPFHQLSNVFTQTKPNYRCLLPLEPSNATYSEVDNGTSCTTFRNGSESPCDVFVYDVKRSTSIVAEFDLVCDRAFLTAVSDSIFMCGFQFGAIGFGTVADRYGRKVAFLTALVTLVGFANLAAAAPYFWLYVALRFMVGATAFGIFSTMFITVMEMVDVRYRNTTGVIIQMFYSVGYMLVALFAYFIPDWRTLQMVVTVPALFFFSYWWLIPESTRWLLRKGRLKEAKGLIQHAAQVNGVKISDDLLQSLLVPDTVEPQITLLQIFKQKKLRHRSAKIFFCWTINSLLYYGLSWGIGHLGGNTYVNFVLSGAAEIPAYIFLLITMNRWGRKVLLGGSFVIAGVSLLLTTAVPQDYDWPTVALAVVGKLATSAGFATIYIAASEQFPTSVRTSILGVAQVFATAGSMLAPFVNLSNQLWRPLPMVLFGSLSLCAAAVSQTLPETLHKRLPETIAEVEWIGRSLAVSRSGTFETSPEVKF